MSPYRCPPSHPRISSAHRLVRLLLRRTLFLLCAIAIILGGAPLALLGPTPAAFAQGSGTLTIKVYEDLGRDGVDTGGAEPGLGNFVVTLYSIDDLPRFIDNTDSAAPTVGIASFSSVAYGDYRVEITPPSGSNYVVSVPGASFTNPGLVFRVRIDAGNPNPVLRVGMRSLDATNVDPEVASGRSIATRVWDDRDADGIQDADEPGISGLNLLLSDSTGTITRTAVAGPDGLYVFPDAPTGGGYRVRVLDPPAGYTLTRPDADPRAGGDTRDSDAALATGFASVPFSNRGGNIDSVDIGFTQGAISGFVFRDVGADGSFDEGLDTRLNGITVELLDSSQNVIATTVTRAQVGVGASDGVYSFRGLAPGDYIVRVPGSEFEQGRPLYGAANSPGSAGDDRATPDGIVSTAVGVTIPVTIDFTDIAGGSNRDATASFGFYQGSIGDFVWYDLNRDGVQDPDEVGLNGVLVFIDANGNGIRDPGELSTTTGTSPDGLSLGYYRFDNLPLGGVYTVTLDPENFLPGNVLEGVAVHTSTATLATNALGQTYYYTQSAELNPTPGSPADLGVDFALNLLDIGNRVFVDANGNGRFDLGEEGIPNVTVELRRAATDSVVTTTLTSAAGVYSIPNLPSRGYYVVFDLATAGPDFADYVGSISPITATVDPAETTLVDYSDLITPALSATSWRTDVFTPTSGIANTGVDAGFYALAELSGRAYFDTDGDDLDAAAPDAEPGMRNIEVRLLRADDSSVVTTALTSDTGAYTFTEVIPGDYLLEFVNPATASFELITGTTAVTTTNPLASDIETISPEGAGRTGTISVTSGETLDEIDAGFRGLGEVSGRVFLDADGSNTQTALDSSLAGATAALTVTANLPNLVATYSAVVSPTNTVASDPNYSFTGLPLGAGVTYDLAISPPATLPTERPYLPSDPDVGDDDLDSDGPVIVITDPTTASLDFDQGFYQEVQVTARVFREIEVDAAGIDNAFDGVDDQGIAGVSVGLTAITGTLSLSETTDATGLVTFTVRPGAYQLAVDQGAAQLAGLLPSPGNTSPVTVTSTGGDGLLLSGEDSNTDNAGSNSFGYFSPASVGGTVFFDRDLDEQKGGEPGVGGVEVVLTGPNGPLTTTTEATGVYSFTGLLPGTYTVAFTNPDPNNFAFFTGGDSNVATTGNVASSATAPFVVASGNDIADVDAGLIGRSEVAGLVFEDLDADGLQNDGSPQPGLAGVTVTLSLDVNLPGLTTTITRQATTDATGVYSFAGLPGDPDPASPAESAIFDLTFTPPADARPWQLTTPEAGDEDLDSDAELTNQTLPRGGATVATEDRDQGFYQDVRVTARVFEELVGTPDNSFQSGDEGIVGATVRLETLTGTLVLSETTVDTTGLVTFTVRPGSYQLNLDESTLPAGLQTSPGYTNPIILAENPLLSGEDSDTDGAGANSFGFFRSSTVSGMVFFDRDLDQMLAGEPGVGGVVVTLSNGTTTLTTTTDATGVYSFTNLFAGTYNVSFTNPNSSNFAFVSGGDSQVNSSGTIANLVVAHGATVVDQNAGLIGRSEVVGFVFEDMNADGLQNDGPPQPAVVGATVTLTLEVNMPGLTTTINRQATIDATGIYRFMGLPGDSDGAGMGSTAIYTVTFQPPDDTWILTDPDSGNNDFDSDGLDQLQNQTLWPNTIDDRDQGYFRNATITARVFDELVAANNDFEPGEVGIGGVEVRLEAITGTLTLSETTVDTTGLVTFTVRPGYYRLDVDELAAPLAGLLPSPGNTDPITVTTAMGDGLILSGESSFAGTPAGANSFGYYRTATISGVAFFDRNLDGQKLGEPGIAGVQVELVQDGTVVGTETTDATGTYTFTDVYSGSYTLVFTNPDPSNFAFFTGGDSDLTTAGAVVTSTINVGTVPFSANVSGQDAGLRGLAAVGGRAFEDADADGRSDGPLDGPLAGATVTLTVEVDLPGLTTTITRQATTGATGVYSFTGLPGGGNTSFTLSFQAPDATWTLTDPDVGDDDGDSDGAADLTNQPLAAGQQAARDQGYFRSGIVTARVFDEQVAINNSFEAGEAGIAGVTVEIDTTPPESATTDATGLVTFTVKPGNYTLTAATPAGYAPSPSNTGTATVSAVSGQTRTADFGYFQPASIAGTVWFDTNRNGRLDQDEPGMEGVTVTLRASTGGPDIDQSVTDATGAYTITGVLPSGIGAAPTSYQLCFTPAAGFTPTVRAGATADDNTNDANADGCTDAFTVEGSGAILATLDAGFLGTHRIGDLVWNDLDGDGVQDANEPGLAGAVVTLEISTAGSINSSNPTLVMTATSTASTNLASNYAVTGVPPASGVRVVSVTPPVGFVPTAANAPAATEATDSDAVGDSFGAVPPDNLDVDFGFVALTTVGDTVWLDLNNNGRLDAGEPGVPDVQVELLRSGTVISTTTTGTGAEAGRYAFVDVAPGTYSLRFTPPTGYTFTNNGAGAIATDGDNDAKSDGTTVEFALSSGQQLLSVDAGLRGTGAISGLVWVETNRNHVRDADETGRIAGVQVTLTLTPTLGTQPLVRTATTAADGSYSFTGLPEGRATVSFARPVGYAPVTPNAGPDTTDSDGPVASLDLAPGQQVDNLDMGYIRQGMVVFLPMLQGRVERADLVASISVTRTSNVAYTPVQIAVTVTNNGDGPASNFWVDLYINPSRRPEVNDRWNDICGTTATPCQGLAWFYAGTLAPGQSVTLVSTATSATSPTGYERSASIWSGTFFNGTSMLYALVDSWNRDETGAVRDPEGAVREEDESNNLAELPIVVTRGTPPPELQSAAPAALPTRTAPRR